MFENTFVCKRFLLSLPLIALVSDCPNGMLSCSFDHTPALCFGAKREWRIITIEVTLPLIRVLTICTLIPKCSRSKGTSTKPFVKRFLFFPASHRAARRSVERNVDSHPKMQLNGGEMPFSFCPETQSLCAIKRKAEHFVRRIAETRD